MLSSPQLQQWNNEYPVLKEQGSEAGRSSQQVHFQVQCLRLHREGKEQPSSHRAAVLDMGFERFVTSALRHQRRIYD